MESLTHRGLVSATLIQIASPDREQAQEMPEPKYIALASPGRSLRDIAEGHANGSLALQLKQIATRQFGKAALDLYPAS